MTAPRQHEPVRVLVVDDSATVRAFLRDVIDAEPDMIVVGTAESAEAAVGLCCKLKPSLVTMDVCLPGADGIEATAEIMRRCPAPVAIVTAAPTGPESDATFRALTAGAVEVFAKPNRDDFRRDPRRRAEFARQLRLVAGVGVVGLRRTAIRVASESVGATRSAPPVPGRSGPPVRAPSPHATFQASVVAVGASTGGPPAIRTVLAGLNPEVAPPVLVVQHMSTEFMPGFAAWLDGAIALPVHLAKTGEPMQPGYVYVAPGDRHLRVSGQLRLELGSEDPVHYQRPAVDELFSSVARHLGGDSVGVLLTGMGSDGARGLAAMRSAGALTIAQDESSCVVSGMPSAAIALDAASLAAPPETIARWLEGVRHRPGSAPQPQTPFTANRRTA